MKKILAIALLLVMVFSLCACPNTDGPGGPGGTDKEGDWLDHIDEYEEANGDIDLGGQTLNISCRDDYVYEIYADAKSQEGVDPQVYERNKAIEKRFNVKVNPIITTCKGMDDQTTHFNEVSDALQAGQFEYDVISMWAYRSGKLILAGRYLDWRSKDSKGNYVIPFAGESIVNGEEWWPTKMNAPSSVLGKQYVAVSDMSLSSFEMAYAMIYNYNMAENLAVASKLGYKDMYAIVEAGAWDLNLFDSIVKDMYTDSSTSGQQGVKDEADTYGLLIGENTEIDAFIHSLGYEVIHNNGTDLPTLWNVDSGMIETIEQLAATCNSSGAWKSNCGTVAKYDQFFTERHALFAAMKLERLRYSILHNMEDDYGILPYPKLNADQKEYLTGSDDHYNVLSIPLNPKGIRTQLIGVVIEALSAETCKSVKDTFYSKLLKTNSTRNLKDEAMIDLIMEGRVYDLVTYHHSDLWIEQNVEGRHLHAFFRVLVKEIPNGMEVQDYWAKAGSLENDFSTLLQKYLNPYGGSGM